MTTVRAPSGLGTKGRRLWRELTEIHDFDPAERVLLEESCRIADRLDKLDAFLSGEADAWIKFRVSEDASEVTVVIDSALSEARQQANVLKQLVAALRLPDDASGKRPQQRGGARGAYKSTGKAGAGSVSSLERARAARGG